MTWWLMPRTLDPEVGGSSPTRVKPCCVLEQGTFTPQKVLVIPRKRWLRPNMIVYRDVMNQSTNHQQMTRHYVRSAFIFTLRHLVLILPKVLLVIPSLFAYRTFKLTLVPFYTHKHCFFLIFSELTTFIENY